MGMLDVKEAETVQSINRLPIPTYFNALQEHMMILHNDISPFPLNLPFLPSFTVLADLSCLVMSGC